MSDQITYSHTRTTRGMAISGVPAAVAAIGVTTCL